MRLGEKLVQRGKIHPRQLVSVLEEQVAARPGAVGVAVEAGYLSPHQAVELLSVMADEGSEFAEAATRELYLTEEEVGSVQALLRARTPRIGDILVRRGVVTEGEVEELVGGRSAAPTAGKP